MTERTVVDSQGLFVCSITSRHRAWYGMYNEARMSLLMMSFDITTALLYIPTLPGTGSRMNVNDIFYMLHLSLKT